MLGNITISPLSESLGFLKEFGFFEVVLPLILVFAIFYGVLIVTKVFGEPDEKTRPLYAIISFVAAFFVIASTDVVRMINEIIPSASFLLIVVVLLLMVMGMFGFTPAEKDFFKDTGWSARIILIILVILFLGVVDMSMEDVEIPVIHNIAEAFVGGDDSGTGGGGAGGGLSDEDYSDLINISIVLALMVGLPIATIYFIVKSGK